MATEPESLPPEEKVRRQVGRTVANTFAILVSLGILGAWAFFGYYELDPGENAVILRLGRYSRTVTTPGPRLHWPPPLETHDIVRVASIEKEQFGYPTEGDASQEQKLEGSVQTKDNNIVHIGFVVQYRIKDAFFSRYRVADPESALRDTAQAAIREVIGRTAIDGVLSEQRGAVETETEEQLQQMLDSYDSGLLVVGVQLLDAQPPDAVRASFDDVIAASQDRSRKINEAQGYANEVLPKARAEATELRRSAEGYRDSKIAEAEGEAGRFSALLVEYRKAPEVTRQRLYLETMEEVMPGVEKVIIEPGSNVLPYLPLGQPRVGAGGGNSK